MANVSVNDYKLMRARDGRMLAGVAAGLSQASGLDVTLVRLCLGAMILSGWGVAAYILMWIILPEERPSRGKVIEPAPDNTARIIRIAVVGLAVLSLFNKVGGLFSFTNAHGGGIGFDGAIGLMLLGVGAAVLFSRHRPQPLREMERTFSEARPRKFSVKITSDKDDEPVDLYEPEPELDAAPDPLRVATAIVDGDNRSSGGAALGWARVVGWLCLIWWIVSALAFLGLWAIDAVDVDRPVLLVAVSGFVFVAVLNTLLHAKFARAIIPALALLLIPTGIAAATSSINGRTGDFVYHPTDDTKPLNFRVAAGRMEIDLANTVFTEDNATVSARVSAGQLIVVVPNKAAVTVHAKTTTAGALELFGRGSKDWSPDANKSFEGCEGGPKLTLNLRTGTGFIQVKREGGNNPHC